jgi:PAS domain-containing protein
MLAENSKIAIERRSNGDRRVLRGTESTASEQQQIKMADITERKLIEEAWRSSELRYRRLFESAKDGILILDADSGQIVDVNPYLIKILAYSKAELVGKELWEIGPFKDIVASKLAFAELQQRG